MPGPFEEVMAMSDRTSAERGGEPGRVDLPSTYERPRVNPGIFIAAACVALVVGAAALGIAMSG
jgi:hypothetical protein